jgi:hypothetical protein
MNFVNVYIDINIRRISDSLFSILLHTLILINYYTHIHKQEESKGAHWKSNGALSYTNINIPARQFLDGKK